MVLALLQNAVDVVLVLPALCISESRYPYVEVDLPHLIDELGVLLQCTGATRSTASVMRLTSVHRGFTSGVYSSVPAARPTLFFHSVVSAMKALSLYS